MRHPPAKECRWVWSVAIGSVVGLHILDANGECAKDQRE